MGGFKVVDLGIIVIAGSAVINDIVHWIGMTLNCPELNNHRRGEQKTGFTRERGLVSANIVATVRLWQQSRCAQIPMNDFDGSRRNEADAITNEDHCGINYDTS
ncbi:hypothetical protein AMTR_s00068p00019550 [Amborella trichopoda]|uniref:Uncharacterized protein n=1 Tax=Amborella trichopoda TaxID=13333 RepID=U5DCV0_AMBTC|nr:hypothetical protein AMTR_s00068p00019550 [Amborella trichopoda]